MNQKSLFSRSTIQRQPVRPGFRKAHLAIAVAAGLGVSAAAVAQSSLVLEEVIVTATKRQEVLSDVASTVNVVTGESLNQFNVFQFEDVQKMTPGLSLRNFTARSSGISMRGAPYNPDSSAQPTVVTYWNGVMVLPNVAFNQLFDIERVEVLRGAQGTLQGETSPSGSIQIHTQKANSYATDGYLRQSFDDNEGSVTEFAVGMPLLEGKAGVRVSGVQSENALWDEKSINSGEDASSRTKAGRINFYLTPTDELDISLTYEYLERDADGLTLVEGSSRLGNGQPDLDTFDRISLEEGHTKILSRNELLNLAINYEIAGHTVSWVSGYQDILHSADLDLDSGNILGGFAARQTTDSSYEVWSHELRFTNNDAEVWEYLFGLYYYNMRTHTVNSNLSPAMFSYIPGFMPPTVGLSAPGFPAMPRLGLVDSTTTVPVNQETFAVFMNHKFYLTDALTMDFGMRWQTARQTMKLTTRANTHVVFDPTDPALDVHPGDVLAVMPGNLGVSDNEAVTGSLKLSYDINPDWMVYGSYGRSYRPGGSVAEPTLGIDLGLVGYDEETSDSLEFGFKAVLAGGRYQINGAAYYQEFDGFINRSEGTLLALPDQQTGVPSSVLNTALAGGINYNTDAIIRGAELEATALMTENWLLFGALSYTDAKFDDARVPCGDFGDTPDPGSQLRTCQSDGRMGNSPNWSATVSSEYTFRDVVAGADAYVRGLYRYSGSQHDDFAAVNSQLYDEYRIGGYGVWDLYLGVRAPDESWDISLWAKNLFDKEARTALGSEFSLAGTNAITGNGELLGSGYSMVSVIPERTIGITGTWRFGAR